MFDPCEKSNNVSKVCQNNLNTFKELLGNFKSQKSKKIAIFPWSKPSMTIDYHTQNLVNHKKIIVSNGSAVKKTFNGILASLNKFESNKSDQYFE